MVDRAISQSLILKARLDSRTTDIYIICFTKLRSLLIILFTVRTSAHQFICRFRKSAGPFVRVRFAGIGHRKRKLVSVVKLSRRRVSSLICFRNCALVTKPVRSVLNSIHHLYRGTLCQYEPHFPVFITVKERFVEYCRIGIGY